MTTPLTKDEIEKANDLAKHLWNFSQTTPAEMLHVNRSEAEDFHQAAIELCQMVEPMTSELTRLRELLERAPESCQRRGVQFLECIEGARCNHCTWNAERRLAMGVGR